MPKAPSLSSTIAWQNPLPAQAGGPAEKTRLDTTAIHAIV
jgi:hypothetical protein